MNNEYRCKRPSEMITEFNPVIHWIELEETKSRKMKKTNNIYCSISWNIINELQCMGYFLKIIPVQVFPSVVI